MYPSEQKPFAGVFVKNQVEILRKEQSPELHVTVDAMLRRFTSPLGTLLKYMVFALKFLPRIFQRYDIVHVHFFIPLGFLGAVYKVLHPRSRLVVTFHGGDVNARHFNGIPGKFWRAVSTRIDYGIAVGPGVEESVKKYLAVDNCNVRPAGVDSRKFFPPAELQIEKKYDFLFAGSFSHRKGIDLLVEALGDERFASQRLAFVGTGPMRNLIESLASSRQCEILDHLSQDELRQVYWASKFLVLPSRSEPFGLVVSEAMYCGTPVIASDDAGPMLQMQHGENGFAFANGSVEELRKALTTAMNLDEDDYRRMVANATKSNRDFDIFEVTRDLAGQYRSLCAM